MRKKYLSALLFGALLFASAGTFTSCKDYDDDINNLQEQINTINTTLTELKSQIGTAGVSSVTFDEATGILTVTDGTGTKNYTIATSATAMVEAEIKDGKLYINDEEIGAVVGEVTVKDGKLMVDGKEVATLGGENGVSLVKNEDDQTYTLTVGGTSVVLPANADATTVPSVEFENDALAANTWDVAWGVAASDVTFGDVTYKAGSLLLGGMTDFSVVNVKPVTYDLSAQKLALVDIDGNPAPVKVVPSTDEETGTTSRAMVSANGKWYLSLEMLDTVTEENIATAFTKKVNGVDQNLKYALTINGTRVTGYNIVIDTQTKNESDVNTAIEDGDLGAVNAGNKYDGYIAKVNAGEVSMQLGQFVSVANKDDDDIATFDFNQAGLTVLDASKIVSSYFEVTDVNAEAAGIKADGMTVTIPASATGKVYDLKLNVLDVTGAKTSHLVKIVVGASEISTVDKVSQVDFTITSNDDKITVPFGEIFSKIDANTALQIKGYKLTTADKNFFALSDLDADDNGYYEVVDGNTKGEIVFYTDAKYEKPLGLDDGKDIRSILGAKIELYNNSTYYQTGADKFENIYGAFELKLTLTDANGNALKNIVIPVKVSAPEFSDLYKNNTYAGWDADGAITTVLNATTVEAPDFDKLFVKAADGKPITGVTGTFNYKYKEHNTGSAKDHASVTLSEIAKEDPAGIFSIEVSSVTVEVKNEVAKVQLSDESTQEPVNVETSFAMKLAPQYSGAKLVYYKDNVALDKAVVGVDEIIAAYDQTNKDDDKATPLYTGLALVYGTEKPVPFKWYTATASPTDETATSNNLGLIAQGTPAKPSDNQIGYSIDLTETSIGAESWTGESFGGQVKITGLAQGQGGTLKVTFVDDLGVKSEATIDYVKE